MLGHDSNPDYQVSVEFALIPADSCTLHAMVGIIVDIYSFTEILNYIYDTCT